MDEGFVLQPSILPTQHDNDSFFEHHRASEDLQRQLLFVHKPAKMHCVPPRQNDGNDLTTIISSQFPSAKPCHRLDFDTSGVMVYGLTKEAHSAVSQQFQDRSTKKTYLALVYGHVLDDDGVIDIPIGKQLTEEGYNQWALLMQNDNERNTSDDNTNDNPIVKPRAATTHYKVLDRYTSGDSFEYSLVQLTPKTGRGHQLRLHMKALGHEILGDTLHGTSERTIQAAPRLCLHAQDLKLDWQFDRMTEPCRIKASSIAPF